ncbi:MAG: hypothetical protein NTY02_12370, partial [Acidobacteria bacterium]|nr:hypothetical protein [Acidobacteriota bacterium]
LVAATVRFRAGLQTAGRQPVLVWSGAGLVAFFATCLTGHPLLVQPVAAVTGITLGAVVALADRTAVPARGLPEAREESTRGTVLTRLVAVGLPIAVCLVIASVPFRAEALRHDTDLTHVKYGFIGRFFESGTREAYWLAGPDASFFVKADDAFARVWIGGSEFEQPVEVEIRVNGQPVRMTPVQKYAWQEYKMLLPMPRKSVPFVRIDLKVTNAAGSPPPAAVPPEALARPRVRVSGMEGVPKRRSP